MRSLAASLRSPGPRRGRPPTAGLRDRILAAAGHVFAREGYDAVSVEEIARRAGVAKGTLYLYFPSKRDLYLELVLSGVRRLARELEAELSRAGSSAGGLERFVRCLLAHFWDRLAFFSLLQRGEPSRDRATREWLDHRARIRRILEETIRRGIEAGEVRPVDPLRASEMLLGMMRGAILDRRPTDTPARVAEEVVDTFLHGVSRAGAPAGRRRGRP